MKKIVLELAKIVLFFIILWWVIVHITYILRNDTDEKENLMAVIYHPTLSRVGITYVYN